MDASRRLMGAQPDALKRGVVRHVVHRLARETVWPVVKLLEWGHLFGRWLLNTEYKTAGGCKKRGACCHHILLEWSPWLDRFPFLGRLVLWKLTRFYNFYDKGYTWEVEDGLMVRVLGCHSLTADGRCGEYRLRPMFCRTYPEIPLAGRPMVLKGCGYHFVRRDGRDVSLPVPKAAPDDLVQIGRRVR